MRKTTSVTIGPEGGRDAGKIYILEEMSASQAEWWATRAVLALTRAGIDFPENAGMAELASIGVKALGKINPHDAKPLMDEMMGCVKIQRDKKNPMLVHPLMEEDIEEVATRFRLKMGGIHTSHGFLFARRKLDIDFGSGSSGIDYPNVPRTIGAIISSGKVTLHELDTVYGLQDVYDMLEVIIVDAYNRKKTK